MEFLNRNTWEILEEHVLSDIKTIGLPYELVLVGEQVLQPLSDGFIVKKPVETIEVNDYVIIKGEDIDEKKKVFCIKVTLIEESGNDLKIYVAEADEIKISEAILKKETEVKAMHGTIMQGNEQLDKMRKSTDKFPLIFLHEITREKLFPNRKDLYERESDLELFFLCEADFQSWNIEDHYKFAIKPMRDLCNKFIQECSATPKIGKFESFEIFEHARFGVYYTDKGHTEKIFNENLSGIQLKITLPFFKDCFCKKKTESEADVIVNYLGNFGTEFDKETSEGIIYRIIRKLNGKIKEYKQAIGTWNNRKNLTYE